MHASRSLPCLECPTRTRLLSVASPAFLPLSYTAALRAYRPVPTSAALPVLLQERKCSTGNMQVEVVQHPLRPLQISRQDSGWEGPDGPYDSAGLSLEVAKTVEERVGGLLARQLADLQASLAAKLDSMQVALVPTVGSHGGAFAGELAASLQDHLASTQESVRGAQAAILAGVQSASEDTLHQLESLEELVAASEAARGEAHSELVAAQGSNHEDVRAAVANVLVRALLRLKGGRGVF